MPNWCKNFLRVNNDERVKIINAEGEVDYSILLPMPEDLSDTSEKHNWRYDNWGVKWNALETKITPEKNDILIFFYSPTVSPTKWLQKLSEEGVKFVLDWTRESGPYGTTTGDGQGNIDVTVRGDWISEMNEEEGGEADA